MIAAISLISARSDGVAVTAGAVQGVAVVIAAVDGHARQPRLVRDALDGRARVLGEHPGRGAQVDAPAVEQGRHAALDAATTANPVIATTRTAIRRFIEGDGPRPHEVVAIRG
jgi:hypothetical protein